MNYSKEHCLDLGEIQVFQFWEGGSFSDVGDTRTVFCIGGGGVILKNEGVGLQFYGVSYIIMGYFGGMGGGAYSSKSVWLAILTMGGLL